MTGSGEARFAVTMMSPCVSTTDGEHRSGMLGYGWTPDDPFVVSVRVSIARATFPVEADIFPGGLSCSQCHGQISWGGYACAAGEGYLICLNCGRSLDKLNVNTQDWNIGVSLFMSLMEGHDDAAHMPGEVQLYRAANGELTMVLSDVQAKHSIRILAPWSNLKVFLIRMADYRSSIKLPLENQYLDSGVDELERLANSVE